MPVTVSTPKPVSNALKFLRSIPGCFSPVPSESPIFVSVLNSGMYLKSKTLVSPKPCLFSTMMAQKNLRNAYPTRKQ